MLHLQAASELLTLSHLKQFISKNSKITRLYLVLWFHHQLEFQAKFIFSSELVWKQLCKDNAGLLRFKLMFLVRMAPQFNSCTELPVNKFLQHLVNCEDASSLELAQFSESTRWGKRSS